ncbi:FACT complex subunit SPT16-like protein, partial [Tanacetum coccineum]
LKSSALHLRLFGYEFPETIMVFSDKWIHFLCSQKKASVLDVVKKCAKDVVMHFYIVFGHIAKETQSPEGKFEEKWVEKLMSSRLQLNDLTNGLAHLFVVKEDNELTNVRKSAHLAASLMEQHVVREICDVIDKEKVVYISFLVDGCY